MINYIFGTIVLFNMVNLIPFAQSQDAFKLTPEQESLFYQRGYITLEKLFAPEEVDTFRSCMDDLREISGNIFDKIQAVIQESADQPLSLGGYMSDNGTSFEINKFDVKTNSYHVDYKGSLFVLKNTNDEKMSIRRIAWAGAAKPELLSLSRQPKLLIPIGQLLGSDYADQLINGIHYKIPGDKLRFRIHQDVKNRRFFDPNWTDVNGKGSFVLAIIAVDAHTLTNGPLYVVPGLPKGDLFLDKMTDLDEINQKARINEAVPLLLNQGDVILMHPYTPHFSEPNESSDTRYTLFDGFSVPGANHEPYPGVGSCERITLVRNFA